MFDDTLLITYILSIVLFLGTPGPVTVLVVSASIKDGFGAGLRTVIGTNTASLILILLSFAIMRGVFSINEQALTWLAFVGAFYLLYFSIGVIKDKVNLQETIKENENKVTKKHFRDGFLIGISNPKDILFFIAFFPTFLDIYTANQTISMMILVAVWIVMDYAILLGYSFFFSKINNERMVNIISKSSGIILLLVALYAIYKMGYELFF
ncbi:LysE family translocator [Pelistega sp. NLN82]|uniref:LysE family translocator n=1 Tax=Pelistega ratti TaxID=2652177 RepID=A0A6L9Y4X9_9BURK|nr:LysE family translocator [Pelistega ratti]NEN75027.1 LysE family translocator [Pelistega ratti]